MTSISRIHTAMKVTAATAVALALAGAVAIVSTAWSAPLPERLSTRTGTVVTWNDGSLAHVFLAPDDRWRLATSVGEVDTEYVDAVVHFEDKRFWRHPGVDPIAFARALSQNLWHGEVVSGASTLTMQLVRMVEPRPRTIRSKLVEMHRALTLEMHMSKEEILAYYLMFAPFGRNVEGVQAASLAYFGHPATHLSSAEIATLLAVPQNPTARYPTEGHATALKSARDRIAIRVFPEGDQRASVEASPVPTALRPFPRDIPHVATWLVSEHPGRVHIGTTLDRSIQQVTERTVERVRDERERQGIRHTSAVIVDHASDQVVALVGGFDFWRDGLGDQIPSFAVPRSPGSALKPFIYARGIDKGESLPDHLVLDVPVRYGTYAPSNYDGNFEGLVRLEDALSRSLNLPFIGLLQQTGVEDFVGLLTTAGAESLDPTPGYYGLSMAIGGVELTPLEMAGLYATLARGGQYRPLVLEDTTAACTQGIELFSTGSSWLTQRALSLRDRPDFPARRDVSSLPRGIAWKTGTSYGHRDAWAAGWTPQYTAVVWMGNLDNGPSSSLVGAQSAGPVLFDLLEGVTDNTVHAATERRPTDLTKVSVCAYSGHLATEACPRRHQVWAQVNNVPIEKCPYHVHMDVDEATGEAVTPSCREGRTTQRKAFVTWPASVRRWLTEQHRHVSELPTLAAACMAPGLRSPPAITHPSQGGVSMLIPGVDPTDQEIPFEADVDDPDGALSWFVDGELLAVSAPQDRVWWTPQPGHHEVVVVDRSGLSDRRAFEVRAGRGAANR